MLNYNFVIALKKKDPADELQDLKVKTNETVKKKVTVLILQLENNRQGVTHRHRFSSLFPRLHFG